MPTSVRQVFEAADLEPSGVVRWGVVPPLSDPGVYVVALTDDPDSTRPTLSEAPLSNDACEELQAARPELTLDGQEPETMALTERIARFWLRDEVILYVGKAASLSRRTADFYRTPLGARRPHSGGYFLKLLKDIGELFVHYAACDDPVAAEQRMLAAFCVGVSDESLDTLFDPDHPFPFANLEYPPGVRKAHGLKGVRESRSPKPASSEMQMTTDPLTPQSGREVPRQASSTSYRTQRVTEADLRAGQIRIPVSTPTKSLFPSERGNLTIVLRGKPLDARWDPRMGPDRERSGVIRVADKETLRALVRPDEVLRVTVTADGNLTVG